MDMLPEFLRNEEDMATLDYVFDKVAAHTRWSNWDVAKAFCKLVGHIEATNPSMHGARDWS